MSPNLGWSQRDSHYSHWEGHSEGVGRFVVLYGWCFSMFFSYRMA